VHGQSSVRKEQLLPIGIEARPLHILNRVKIRRGKKVLIHSPSLTITDAESGSDCMALAKET
jgi:hypothetical protein